MRVDQKKDGQVQHGHPQIWLSTRVFWNVEILGPHPRTIRTSADGKFLLKVEENMFQWLISLMGEWKGPAKKNIIYHHLPIFSKSMELQIHLDHLGSAMINASRQNIYVYQYHPGINQKLVDSSAIAGSGGSGNSSERARCCQRLNGCLGGVHFSQQFTDRSCLCLKRSIDIKKDHNNKYLYLSCIETYSLQRIRTLLAALVGVIMHVFFLNTSHRLHRRPHCRKKRKSRPVKIMGQEPPKSLCNVASFLPKTFVVTLW